jgi:hypothetical protein
LRLRQQIDLLTVVFDSDFVRPVMEMTSGRQIDGDFVASWFEAAERIVAIVGGFGLKATVIPGKQRAGAERYIRLDFAADADWAEIVAQVDSENSPSLRMISFGSATSHCFSPAKSFDALRRRRTSKEVPSVARIRTMAIFFPGALSAYTR